MGHCQSGLAGQGCQFRYPSKNVLSQKDQDNLSFPQTLKAFFMISDDITSFGKSSLKQDDACPNDRKGIAALYSPARRVRAGSKLVKVAEQSKGMSTQQLLQLAQSMAKKRLTATDSGGGYESLMLYIHILKVSSHPPVFCNDEILFGCLFLQAYPAASCCRHSGGRNPNLPITLELSNTMY